MKKNLRNIQVRGLPYVWRVTDHEDEPKVPYIKLTVWQNKKVFLEQVYHPNPFCFHPVTPHAVGTRILHELSQIPQRSKA